MRLLRCMRKNRRNVVYWQEVSWIVPSEHRALLEEHLEAHGAMAISAHNATQEPSFESEPGVDPDWQSVRVVALFGETPAAEGILHAIEKVLGHCITAGQARRFEDRDWVADWSQSLQPQCFGERLWVVPHGQEVPQQAEVVVRLDPGMAFGSGTHETTRLCLEWLVQQELDGCTVVDYGCGSGILGIAALRLGARRVLACDIDLQAIEATAENARRNAVSADLQVSRPENMELQPADIVLANILLQALVDHAAVLAQHVRADGRLVLSGVLQSQLGILTPAFASNFTDFQVQTRNDWCCVVARRRCVRDTVSE